MSLSSETAKPAPGAQTAERQLEAVYRITKALHCRTNLEEILSKSLQAALDTLDAEAGSIFLHDPEAKALLFSSIVGEKAATLLGAAIPDNAGNAGSVFQSGIALITNNITQSGDYYADIDQKISFTTRNIVTVPLRSVDNKRLGVFQVLNKRHGPFLESDLAVLTIVATLAGTALDNARLFHDAKAAEQVRLLGDISHDIKNMLVPVLTGIETLASFHHDMCANITALRQQYGNAATRALWCDLDRAVDDFNTFFPDAVAMALESGERIQARVRDVADAVKGVISQPAFVPTNVTELAQSVLRALKPLADKNGTTLVLQTACLDLMAPVDDKRLYNAIYNLLDNALAATAPGGTIQIQLTCSRDGQPFPHSDYLQIQVIDDGCGMPQHIVNRLFCDNALSTKRGGTGLGTCIVKKVVAVHGGTIAVDSTPDVGTTITLRLPLTQ